MKGPDKPQLVLEVETNSQSLDTWSLVKHKYHNKLSGSTLDPCYQEESMTEVYYFKEHVSKYLKLRESDLQKN